MRRRCSGSVVWFSLEEPGSRVRDFIDNHCRNGGRAVVLDRTDRGDMIVIRHGRRSMQLAWTHLLPSTFGGTALFNVANAMAAAGAAFASGAGLHEIRQGLRTFTTSYYLSPGRMNQINVHNVDVIVDYCHNAPGMRVLGEFLERYAAMKAGQTDLGKISRIGMIATAGDRRESDMRELGVGRGRALRRRRRARGRAAARPGARVHRRARSPRASAAGSASPGCAAARSRSCSTRPRRCATSWPAPNPGDIVVHQRRPARGGDVGAGVDDQAGPAGHAHPRRASGDPDLDPETLQEEAREAGDSAARDLEPAAARRLTSPATMASTARSAHAAVTARERRPAPSRRTGATPSCGAPRRRFFGAWTAEWAVTVVLAVYAYGRGGATEVGVVALVRVLPAAVVAPLATQYADRWPREKVLVAVSAVRAVSIALAGWAVFVDGPALRVYALVTVSSAAAVLFRPVHSALLPSLCDTPPELAGANVVRGALDSAATLAGPAISAVLLATGGPAQVLAVAAVASAWAGWLMARVHPEPTPLDDGRARHRGRRSARALGGVRAVHANPDLRLLIGLIGAQTFMRGAITVFTVVVAVELVGLGDPGVGVLNAALGAGAVLASAAAALLVGTRRLAAWFGLGAALWGAPLVVIGLVPSAASAMVMLAVVGAGNALIDVGGFTLIARISPANVLARVFGVLESVVALCVGLGALLTPLVMDALDLRTAWSCSACSRPSRSRSPGAGCGPWTPSSSAATTSWPCCAGSRCSTRCRCPRWRRWRASSTTCVVPAGETVFRQGDAGDRFYVVVAGTAEVVGDGRPITGLGPGRLVRRDRAAAPRAAHGDRAGGRRAAPGVAARRQLPGPDDGVTARPGRDLGPRRRDARPVRPATGTEPPPTT